MAMTILNNKQAAAKPAADRPAAARPAAARPAAARQPSNSSRAQSYTYNPQDPLNRLGFRPSISPTEFRRASEAFNPNPNDVRLGSRPYLGPRTVSPLSPADQKFYDEVVNQSRSQVQSRPAPAPSPAMPEALPRAASDLMPGDKRSTWLRGPQAPAQATAAAEAEVLKRAADVIIREAVNKQGVAAVRSFAPQLIKMLGAGPVLAALSAAGIITGALAASIIFSLTRPAGGLSFEPGTNNPLDNTINPPDVGENPDMPFPPEDDGIVPADPIPYQTKIEPGTLDHLELGQAFYKAQGIVGNDSTFNWHGKMYSTRSKALLPYPISADVNPNPDMLATDTLPANNSLLPNFTIPRTAQNKSLEQAQSQVPAPTTTANPQGSNSLLGPDPLPTPSMVPPTAAGPLGTPQAKIEPGTLDKLELGQAFHEAQGIVGNDSTFPWRGRIYSTRSKTLLPYPNI